MAFPTVIPVAEQSQVGEARRAVAALAGMLGFSEAECGNAAIVATEAATNLVKHARDGVLLLRRWRTGRVFGIEVLALDCGPGMTDVSRCLARRILHGRDARRRLRSDRPAVVRLRYLFPDRSGRAASPASGPAATPAGRRRPLPDGRGERPEVGRDGLRRRLGGGRRAGGAASPGRRRPGARPGRRPRRRARPCECSARTPRLGPAESLRADARRPASDPRGRRRRRAKSTSTAARSAMPAWATSPGPSWRPARAASLVSHNGTVGPRGPAFSGVHLPLPARRGPGDALRRSGFTLEPGPAIPD